MIDATLVQEALAPPPDWVDTTAQAQLRQCLASILSGLEPVDAIIVCHSLVTVMRDQLMTGVRNVRGTAAKMARENLSAQEIAEQTGQTMVTIARLLTEPRGSRSNGTI